MTPGSRANAGAKDSADSTRSAARRISEGNPLIYIYIYMYIHMHKQMHTRKCIHVYINICIHIHLLTCLLEKRKESAYLPLRRPREAPSQPARCDLPKGPNTIVLFIRSPMSGYDPWCTSLAPTEYALTPLPQEEEKYTRQTKIKKPTTYTKLGQPPAPPNYPLRNPKYHLIDTIRP